MRHRTLYYALGLLFVFQFLDVSTTWYALHLEDVREANPFVAHLIEQHGVIVIWPAKALATTLLLAGFFWLVKRNYRFLVVLRTVNVFCLTVVLWNLLNIYLS